VLFLFLMHLATHRADGRVLVATRDIAEPPLLQDIRAAIPCALWRASGNGLVSVAFPHKRLPYSLHESHVVPLEVISGAERAYEALLSKERSQASTAQEAANELDMQLQGVRTQLLAQSQEHADTVEHLVRQLAQAHLARSQIEQEAHAAGKESRSLQARGAELWAAHSASQAELEAAYAEIARLQAGLDDSQPGMVGAVAGALTHQEKDGCSRCALITAATAAIVVVAETLAILQACILTRCRISDESCHQPLRPYHS
jgi:hypothetical protein